MRTFLIILTLACHSFAFGAAVTTKREFTKDGVVFIEETTKDGNAESTFSYPKEGQDKVSTTTTTAADGSVTTRTISDGPGMKMDVSMEYSKEEMAAGAKDGAALRVAIGECRAHLASTPFPFIPGEMIKMQVHGLTDGKCKFTVAVPQAGVQTCLFSEQKRKEIVADQKAFESMLLDPNICKRPTP